MNYIGTRSGVGKLFFGETDRGEVEYSIQLFQSGTAKSLKGWFRWIGTKRALPVGDTQLTLYLSAGERVVIGNTEMSGDWIGFESTSPVPDFGG